MKMKPTQSLPIEIYSDARLEEFAEAEADLEKVLARRDQSAPHPEEGAKRPSRRVGNNTAGSHPSRRSPAGRSSG